MEFIYEYGIFLAQAVTLVAAIIILVSAVVAIGSRQRADQNEGYIEIRKLNEKYHQYGEIIREVIEEPHALKEQKKAEKKLEKANAKAAKKRKSVEGDPQEQRSRLFVLDFVGDIKASAVENLREEISSVLPRIEPGDEILVRVESPGGLVHGYGLAASQLQRIRAANVPLTIAVDLSLIHISEPTRPY